MHAVVLFCCVLLAQYRPQRSPALAVSRGQAAPQPISIGIDVGPDAVVTRAFDKDFVSLSTEGAVASIKQSEAETPPVVETQLPETEEYCESYVL